MILTCAIIDDEPLAIKLLESYVTKTPTLELVATYASAVEAIADLTENPVDVIFCDIQMPELDGLQFASMIANQHARIVFTTAFGQYAIDGWKADALDYLLKPIAYNDFLNAVQKAHKWFAREAKPLPVESDSFFVKSDYKLVRVRFDDILYVEGLRDYVKIHLADRRRPVVSLNSMRAIEAALPASKFLRTHRSYIVNMDKVEVIERMQFVFDERYVPISESYKEIVLGYVNDRLLQGRPTDPKA